MKKADEYLEKIGAKNKKNVSDNTGYNRSQINKIEDEKVAVCFFNLLFKHFLLLRF